MAHRTPFAQYVLDKINERQESVEEFSERIGVSSSGMYKLFRGAYTAPRQETLEKIAGGFGMTAAELLRAAEAQHEDDPIERHIRQRAADFREVVRGTPQSFWAAIIDAVFDRAIDTARDMAQLVSIARTEDTTPSGSADKDSEQGDSEGPSRRQRPMNPREPAKFEFAQAV